MFLIPISNKDFDIRNLPWVTVGIIVLCTVIFGFTYFRIVEESTLTQEQYERLTAYFQETPQLQLDETFIRKRSDNFKEVYNTQREWVQWFNDDPEAVQRYLATAKPTPASRGKTDSQVMKDVMSPSETLKTIPYTKAIQRNEAARYAFLAQLNTETPNQRETKQQQLDQLFQEYQTTQRNSVANRFGYTPGAPSVLGTISHQFLHGSLFHLLFNMLILWIVAPQLEELWGRGLLIGVYLACGVLGALSHHMAHPESTIPVMGASGATAGLMGAFALRFTKSKIRFFYLYFMIRLKPKTGTFDAPAYFMISLWFIGQVFYATMFDFGPIAYWAPIGGFCGGLGIAAAFRFFGFEQKVLGRDPNPDVAPEKVPLIAFSAQPTPHKSSAALAPDEAPSSSVPIWVVREIKIERFDKTALHCRIQGKDTPLPYDAIHGVSRTHRSCGPEPSPGHIQLGRSQ